MKIAFLFPGQGSQYIGMGKDIYDNYDEVRALYDEAFKVTGRDIASITFNSDEYTLTQTQNTQLAILIMSLGILKVLEKNDINADVVAGLSLGEYTSLIYSGAINSKDGIQLVQKRGEYMQNLLPDGEWSMAAFLGVDEEIVNEVCRKVTDGFVVPVNYNCSGQIVVSGEKKAVLESIEIAKEFGVRRAMELNTSGPFHTIKLQEAADALKNELDKIEINKFEKYVVKNIDGELYGNEDVKSVLYKHMISPVRFDKCINKMLEMGVDTFVEIGPGKTLTNFVKKINKDVQVININDLESLNKAIEILSN